MYKSMVISDSQMRSIDKLACSGNNDLGFAYMQKAGAGAAGVLQYKWGAFDEDEVIVICGKGNNGGDGLVMAQALKELGANPEVLLVSHPENFKNEAQLAWLDFLESQIPWKSWNGESLEWEDSDIIVDAVLGLGAVGEPQEDIKPLLNSILEASDNGIYLVALDAPTGNLNADLTVLFGFTRWSAIDPLSSQYFGELGLVNLEYPEAILRGFLGVNETPHLLDSQWYLPFIPSRDALGDKRSHGTGLLIAGGENMGGAAVLAGLGALRLGIGYLKIGCASTERLLVQSQLIEAPYVDWLALDYGGTQKIWTEVDAIAMGPGLGLDTHVQEKVIHWYQNFPGTMVLDADGLNAFKGRSELLRLGSNTRTGARILTPHRGEFERLFGPLDEPLESIVKRVSSIAQDYGIEILLKGPVSVLASSRGEVVLYNQASSALARAGTGDILTGILLALSTRWLAPEFAFPILALGVWLHGMAADLAKDDLSEISMRSSEIPNYLGQAVEYLLDQVLDENEDFMDRFGDIEDDSFGGFDDLDDTEDSD